MQIDTLFEKATRNLLAAELGPEGWSVRPGGCLDWPIEAATAGMASILPAMFTDIVLKNGGQGRRIIIDTKFTGIFTRSRWRETMLKSPYLYQLYSYVRSQAHPGDPLSMTTEGILLHPAIDADVDETVVIQGHALRFMTVDLTRPNQEIAARLCEVARLHEDEGRVKLTKWDFSNTTQASC